MDTTTALIVIVVVFAIVVLAALWRYRRKGEASIEVGGARVSVKGENDPQSGKPAPAAASPTPAPGGARIKDVEAGKDIRAKDGTGAGASVEGAKAGGSISATSDNPKA